MAFGNVIKKLREEVPISVEKIAKRIGVNADRWRKWEQKDLSPRTEDVQKIESFFGMELAQIQKLTSIKKFLIVPRETKESSKDLTLKDIDLSLKEVRKVQGDILNQGKYTQAEVRAVGHYIILQDAAEDPKLMEELLQIYRRLKGSALGGGG